MGRPLVPLDLKLTHVIQETSQWCWAAVIQMVATHYSRGTATPPQREIARMALGQPMDDRWAHGIPDDAVVPHNDTFIRLMVKLLAQRVSDWYPPSSAEEVYANLYFGNLVILHVLTGTATSHVIVVSGIRPTEERGVFDILLNDPSPQIPGPFWARFDAVQPAVIQHMVVYKDIKL